MKSQNERKRFYVDQLVQSGIVLRMVLFWLLFIVITTLVALSLDYFANPTMSSMDYLKGCQRFAISFALTFAAILPLAIVSLLRFTNRFAGPILRLHSMMRKLASEEQVETLRFREDDYWQDLAKDFNQIAYRLLKAKIRIQELETLLDEQELNDNIVQTELE